MQRATTTSNVFYVSPIPTGGWAVFGSESRRPCRHLHFEVVRWNMPGPERSRSRWVRCRCSTGTDPWKNFSSTHRRATADLRAGERFHRPSP